MCGWEIPHLEIQKTFFSVPLCLCGEKYFAKRP